MAIAGIRNKEKPLLNLLFLGSTGTGKTELVKVLSDIIFGYRDYFTRINCEELGSEHTFSKLIGSPPGYVGNDVEAMLSQDSLDQFFKQSILDKRGLFGDIKTMFYQKFKKYKEEGCLSLVLFDEIEKAHPKILSSIIGIMDDGNLTLGNNEVVNFRSSIIIMTSNVGSKLLDTTLQNNSVGFDIGNGEVKTTGLKDEVLTEAKNHFLPEFCNRLDKMIVFNSLSRQNFRNILDLQLSKMCKRLNLAKLNLFMIYKDVFMEFILDEGVSQRYGARHLERVIQEELVTPVSNLINTGQIKCGDFVEVNRKNGNTIFTREARYNKDFLDLVKKK